MASLDPASFPERIGRYELLLPIGNGGMATVYLARQEMLGGVHRDVAIKLMHAHLRGDPDWATHLLAEATLAARIRHPNVVQVVEVGDDREGMFIALEYVQGDTLAGLLRMARQRGEQVPLPIAGRILLDSLAGLHAAHELKDDDGQPLQLVHRDYSPQNILVGTDGMARLTDFGIAKARGGERTATGILKGKIAYMSPEQALGDPLDRRADVWAAGVVAWEVLAGKRLFGKQDDVRGLLKLLNETPPRLTDARPDIPQQLDDVIANALSKDLDRRTPTAAQLAKQLREAWQTIGGVAEMNDVAAYVTELTSSRLEQRTEQVTRVRSLRRRMLNVSQAAIELASEPHTSSSSVAVASPEAEDAQTLVRAAADPADPPPADAVWEASTGPKRSRRPLWLGAAALTLVGLAAIAVTTRTAPTDATATDATPAPSASAATAARTTSHPNAVASSAPSIAAPSVDLAAEPTAAPTTAVRRTPAPRSTTKKRSGRTGTVPKGGLAPSPFKK